MKQPKGPVILDVVGTELSSEEHDILQHPLVGGVILFARNYQNPQQVRELCDSIRRSRKTPLLICVDHEGGRVQRFRDGFTRLPSMGQIGQLYQNDPDSASELAEACGWLMAAELLSVGIDLSFAPVLDLDKGLCPAIGDRAFAADPAAVVHLATAVMRGMNAAGMAATGKHFPGHGSVNLDSHVDLPVDIRDFSSIAAEDMHSFTKLIRAGIQAIMPAHVIFSKTDDKPVGFSTVWLQDILRKQLQFEGVIFSDDLNMEGAGFAGDYASRAACALEAGCDIVLICNNRHGAVQIIDRLPQQHFLNEQKFTMLQGKFVHDYQTLRQSKVWKEKSDYVSRRNKNEYA